MILFMQRGREGGREREKEIKISCPSPFLCWDPQMKMFILEISTGLFLNKHVSHLPQRKLWTELIPHSPPDLYT